MAKSNNHQSKQDIIDSGYFEFRAEQWLGIPKSRKERNLINVKLNYDPDTYRAIVYRSYTSGFPDPSWNGVAQYSVFYSDEGHNLGEYSINGFCKNWQYDPTVIAKYRWVDAVLYNDPRDFQLGGNLEHGSRDDYWSNFRLEGGQPLEGDYNFHTPADPDGVVLEDSTARFNAFTTFQEADLDVVGSTMRMDSWKPINCIISEDKEGIYVYLNGGPLPDDVEVIGPDGDTDDGDDGDETETTEDTTDNIPAVTVYDTDGACNYYALNSGNVTSFINWVWYNMLNVQETIVNYATNIYNNLADNIEGLRLYPLNVADIAGGTKNVILGRFASSLSVPGVTKQYKFTHSTFTLKGKIRNEKQFYGYEPYSHTQIYLPFVGFRDFPLEIWGPKIVKRSTDEYETLYPTCNIIYGIDFRTGMGVCQLWRSFENKNSLIDEYECQIGIDIPFSAQTGFSIVTNSIQAFADIMPEAKTVKSLMSSSNDDSLLPSVNISDMDSPSAKSMGVRSSMNALYNPFDAYIISRYSVVDLTGDSLKKFNRAYGRACMQSRDLNSVKGFTVCNNVKMEYGHTKNSDNIVVSPTDEEASMIKNLLETGVYL